jgi:hypothetical protein
MIYLKTYNYNSMAGMVCQTNHDIVGVPRLIDTHVLFVILTDNLFTVSVCV